MKKKESDNKEKSLSSKLLVVGSFAVVGILVLTVVRAANSPGVVAFDPSISQTKTDSSANLGTYLEFGTGSQLANRTDFPIRNTAIDSRTQYVNTPSDQIPYQEFLEPRVPGDGASFGRGSLTPTKFLGEFTTQCSFSHLAYDDPIVFPGQPGAAHLHMFFGNTLTNAHSTYDSLLNNGSSTCNGLEGNRTAYWVPAVLDGNGNVRIPTNIELYYKSHSGGFNGANLTNNVYPEDLAFIGGDASGNKVIPGYSPNRAVWSCYIPGASTANLSRIFRATGLTLPTCVGNERLLGHIQFPYCLRGDPKDAINNTSQMEYPAFSYWSGSCPAGTTELPALEYFITYNAEDRDGSTQNWYVASDVNPANGSRQPNGITSHGDWYGAWNRDLFQEMFDNCITTLAWCFWDTVNPTQKLKRSSHWGPSGAAANLYYNGPKTIPASEVSRKLCPNDPYSRPEDVAHCTSAITPQAAQTHADIHGHTDHEHN